MVEKGAVAVERDYTKWWTLREAKEITGISEASIYQNGVRSFFPMEKDSRFNIYMVEVKPFQKWIASRDNQKD